MAVRQGSVGPQSQQGLSIVELLVGIAVGLIVVAGASMLIATQLADNRRLLVETQVQQDLRAAADIITHELRRSGSTVATESFVWSSVNTGATTNPYASINPDSGVSSGIAYNYTRTTAATSPSGFRLSAGKLQTRLPGAVGWQDLTDSRTVTVTAFTVTVRGADEPTPAPPAPQRLPCPKLCSDGTMSCWPVLRVRELQIDIVGQAAADAAVQRSIRSVVRLRSDEVRSDPGGLCPA